MNYFPFHLGDYAAHTGHLEPMEDLAYRRLLDQYYMREGPLPADIQATAKLVRLRSCAADVESVLNEFFTLTDEGWRHSRCDQEIERMKDKQTKARASAAASVNARRANAEKKQTSVERSLVDQQTVVQLPTPTPTPTPKKKDSPELLTDSEPLSGFAIPIIDGSEHAVTARTLAEWVKSFPAVDVEQELREMRAWALANPTKRKTKRGIEAFAVRWLGKAQDTPGRSTGGKNGGSDDWTRRAA